MELTIEQKIEILEKKKLRQKEAIEFLQKRDGDRCQIYFCKHPEDWSDPKNFRTIDHVLPKSKGGLDEYENYVLAHFKCNNKKGDRVYLDDGTLEPLPFKEPKIKVVKKEPCPACNEGRSLDREEICEVCGSLPQPYAFPQWAKLAPKDCPHSGPWWCWAEPLGLYERVPASSDVFGVTD